MTMVCAFCLFSIYLINAQRSTIAGQSSLDIVDFDKHARVNGLFSNAVAHLCT